MGGKRYRNAIVVVVQSRKCLAIKAGATLVLIAGLNPSILKPPPRKARTEFLDTLGIIDSKALVVFFVSLLSSFRRLLERFNEDGLDDMGKHVKAADADISVVVHCFETNRRRGITCRKLVILLSLLIPL